MTWVTWLLLGLGVADLVASALARPAVGAGESRPPWVVPAAAGVAVSITAAALSGPAGPADWVAVALASVTVAGWRWLLGRGAGGTHGARRRLAVLLVPLALALGLSGFAAPVAGPLAAWLAWVEVPALAGLGAERTMLLIALAIANLVTANHVVQLVLASVGAQRPRTEPDPGSTALDVVARRPRTWLRGGRLLGALERLLILGFGVGGYLAAAGLVVAAKGLLRFPELQAAARTDSGSVDQVTEYFLVGTFTSLLVALASVVLVA